jgi:FKBP-type peptidyl-prolyl cis-trans isomerase SlyD
MIVEAHKVVALELEIAEPQGGEVLVSEPERPLVYMHGNGMLVPGLERALEGGSPGTEVDVTLQAEEAFGAVDPHKIQYMDRAQFPPGAELEVGLQFGAQDAQGRTVVLWVTAVEGDTITVNANHPLAGHTLRFRAKIVAIREPTAAEREAGRPLSSEGARGPAPPATP